MTEIVEPEGGGEEDEEKEEEEIFVFKVLKVLCPSLILFLLKDYGQVVVFVTLY